MMRTKWWTLILIFSLAINAAVLGVCGYRYYRYTCGAPSAYCPLSPGDQHFYQGLGLSDAQLERMAPLARTFHAKLDKLSRETERKRELLVDLLSLKEVDSGRIESLRKDMAGIQDQIQKEVITHLLDVREILNPEQKEVFFTLLRRSMKQENNWFSKQGG
jgi:Spy/CpxP family protein refolding chaperone